MTRIDVPFPPRMRSTAHPRTPLRIDSVGLAADGGELASYFSARRFLMKAADPTPKNAVWITPREAAEYLSVGVNIIYDGCAAGGLKHTRLGHRTIRLRRNPRRLGGGSHAGSRSEVRCGRA
jgi:excisionase family DNA binding protein